MGKKTKIWIPWFTKVVDGQENVCLRLNLPNNHTLQRILLVFSMIVVSLNLLGLTPFEEPVTVRVGVYENAPKIYTDQDGNVTGFWPELVNTIAEEENWKIVWVPGSWEECLTRLENHEIDIMPDVGLTVERSQKYVFSNETVIMSWARVYVPKGSTIESIIDLEGKRIAGLSGSLNFDGPEGIKELLTQFGIESTFIEKESYTEVFEALDAGEADAGVTNKDFGNLNEQSYNVVRTSIVIQPTQIKFAFSKDAANSAYLIETIDRHLKQLKEDQNSVYYQLLNKYMGENSQTTFVKVVPQWVYYLLAIAFFAIMFMVTVSVTSKELARKQTVELRASESRMRSLIEGIPDLIFRYDENGTFLDFHTKSETRLYAQPADFLGKNVRDVLPAEIAEKALGKIHDTVASRENQVYEYQLTIDGIPREYEARYSPCGADEVMAIIRDVTVEKQAEARIRLLNRIYATLSQINQTIVHVQDRDQLFREICEVAVRFGQFRMAWIGLIDKDEPVIKPVYFAGEENGYLTDLIIKYLDPVLGAGPTGIAVREGRCVVSRDIKNDPRMLPWKDKALRHGYLASASVPIRQNHQVIGAFSVYAAEPLAFDIEEEKLLEETGQDISFALDNLKADDEHQEAIRQLTKSEQRYQTLANISPVGIFRTDADGATTYVNPTWSRISGLPASQAMGDDWLRAVHPEDRERIIENWRSATRKNNKNTADYRFIHPDGSIVWVIGQAVPEINSNGKIIGYVGTITDITERKQIEDLRLAVEKAESADRLKSAFLATMSHELRTPLNSIIGFTGILLQKLVGPLSDEQEKQLKMVQGSARHLLDLINDVLDISKIEAGEIEIREESFTFDEAIQKSIDKIMPLAEKKGLSINCDLHSGGLLLVSDRRRVEQVLLNLLSNAVKFTDQGRIDIQTRVEDQMITTSVSDSGIGIKKEDLDGLFIPFKQVDSGLTRQYEGTGLGLSICKRIVELLGGKIWVESEWGRGSTFRFTLPLQRKENETKNPGN